jgi:hypothetical protein
MSGREPLEPAATWATRAPLDTMTLSAGTWEANARRARVPRPTSSPRAVTVHACRPPGHTLRAPYTGLRYLNNAAAAAAALRARRRPRRSWTSTRITATARGRSSGAAPTCSPAPCTSTWPPVGSCTSRHAAEVGDGEGGRQPHVLLPWQATTGCAPPPRHPGAAQRRRGDRAGAGVDAAGSRGLSPRPVPRGRPDRGSARAATVVAEGGSPARSAGCAAALEGLEEVCMTPALLSVWVGMTRSRNAVAAPAT